MLAATAALGGEFEVPTLDNARARVKVAAGTQPGQRVRVTFTNPDDMPHNMLVVRPGTIEAVGALADAMMSAPDAAERNYIPATPDVMWYTPLVGHGESTVLEFVAPRQEADYPYVCTFPGHWRIMQGVMTVAAE